jgi:putative copper resistance protein D
VDAALVLARLVAFVSGALLFGAPLFALYSGVAPARLKGLIGLAGLGIALAAGAALVVQTGQMAGDPKAGFDPATLRDMVASSAFGASVLARIGAGAAALIAGLALRPGRSLWAASAALGALALGALPWSGHGAADSGTAGVVHLGADIAHLLAAGVWLGALAAFLLLLVTPRPVAAAVSALHRALHGFSGMGSAVVAVIIATGLVNSWFLVGLDHLSGLWTTAYGRLLCLKLLLFAAMLALAAANRFRLTPALGVALGSEADAAPALAALRRSVAIETLVGFAVLAVVAWLGMQEPISAMG